jgi:hypothetical protein
LISNRPRSASYSALVDRLREKHAALWIETPCATPVVGRTYRTDEQRANGESGDRFTAEVEHALSTYPSQRGDQDNWRRHIGVQFRRFAKQCLGYSDELLNVLLTSQNLEATRKFVHQATTFDSEVDIDDLHQALRNVWVMNSIQMLLGLPATCSASVFAYSMLYPYTDNYLDDSLLSMQEKRMFNRWLEQRLKGAAWQPRNSRERALSQLVQLIENEHSRITARDVYHSLLAIHTAQDNSLQQQSRRQGVSDADLLEISIGKGGTSVLAHGFLVNRTLSDNEADFIFGYGVFLQLLDDLQDVVVDTECQHATLFTETVRRNEYLDGLTSRLYHFMQTVLQGISCFASPEALVMHELIRRNCALLMLQAIARHQQLFSSEFLRQVESYSPMSFPYLRLFPEMVRERYDTAKREFTRRQRNTSIYSVLG